MGITSFPTSIPRHRTAHPTTWVVQANRLLQQEAAEKRCAATGPTMLAATESEFIAWQLMVSFPDQAVANVSNLT